MNKVEVAAKIGKLEGELSKLEGELRVQERLLNSASGNRKAGGAALLIGVLGILFLNYWPLWVFLMLIGALTFFTSSTKQNNAELGLLDIEENIENIRSKLAEYRAQLMIL